MSSTNKTENLNLNQWIGSDKPKMADFNYDNAVIDEAISAHNSDITRHISDYERSRWNNYLHLQTYFGQGSGTQNVVLNCDFTPRVCIVFALAYPNDVADFNNKANYQFLGIASASGSMNGVEINGKTLSVTSSTTSFLGAQYSAFNQKGVTYFVIALR